jgi:hypothetical protein
VRLCFSWFQSELSTTYRGMCSDGHSKPVIDRLWQGFSKDRAASHSPHHSSPCQAHGTLTIRKPPRGRGWNIDAELIGQSRDAGCDARYMLYIMRCFDAFECCCRYNSSSIPPCTARGRIIHTVSKDRVVVQILKRLECVCFKAHQLRILVCGKLRA